MGEEGMRYQFQKLQRELNHLQSESMPRLLLLNSQTKLPLLWRVLSNTFKDKAAFSMSRAKDKISGLTNALNVSVEVTDKSKILYWAPGASEPQVYEGKYILICTIHNVLSAIRYPEV